MLDVTATLEETRREAYAAMLRDTLDSLDWCAAELNSVSEMRFDALRCLGWMTEDLNWLVWATGRNQGFTGPLCSTWEEN